jgi:beta-barrel assembly-enhancing protease
MHHRRSIGYIVVFLACQVALAQFPSSIKSQIDKADKIAAKFKDVEITDEEEIRLGEDISSRIRAKYGVVQDPAVHKYVALVGTVIAKKSSRSNLPFHFIVLDTDGVNAFAAPGGFVHITRGALSLLKSEAELGGVLGHEIAHVTERHTIRAIQKGKVVQMAANEKSVSSNPELFRRLSDECYKIVFAGFGRADELDADDHGLIFSANSGYNPWGLGLFLTRLKERNAGSDVKQGLFASHPEMDERLQKLSNIIKSNNWTGGATLAERLSNNVKYAPVELANIVVAGEGAAGLAGGSKEDDGKKKEDEKKKEGQDDDKKKKSRFSLSKLSNPLGSGEQTKQSAEVTGSGGSRGVDKERMAKGGSNPAAVAVSLTDKDLEEFKKEGQLKA